jgi:hypothetical protein
VRSRLRRFAGGAIVDSLVQTQANKHPVSLIWRSRREIAVLLVVYRAVVLLATVVAVHNSLFTSPG